jgi:hypothetical protein
MGTRGVCPTAAVARHTSCRRPPPRRRVGATAEDEGRRPVTAEEGSGLGAAGAVSRGGPPRRGRRCALGTGTADVRVAELTNGERRCCAGVGEERRGVSERRGASRTGAARRGGGDGDGGSALEGDGAYRTPHLLSRVVLPTVTKGTLVLGRIITRD